MLWTTPGRSCSCLLAISLLILTPAFLPAQSDHPEPAHDFAPPVASPPVSWPRSIPWDDGLRDSGPRDGDPRNFGPRHSPITRPGTFGFPQLAQAAGTIFSGTVTAVAPHPATGSEGIETISISFHVEQAIRGATPGEDLTISQWIALWSSGQRYRVGERVLLFLYPPSKLGLTSCVAGPMGHFQIDPLGRVLLTAQHLSAFWTDPILGGKSHVSFNDFAEAVRRTEATAVIAKKK
jgi:hypothetical protein